MSDYTRVGFNFFFDNLTDGHNAMLYNVDSKLKILIINIYFIINLKRKETINPLRK